MKLLVTLVALALVLTVPASDAKFNARTANPVTVAAASATTYFHLYSRDAVPAPGRLDVGRPGAAEQPGRWIELGDRHGGAAWTVGPSSAS